MSLLSKNNSLKSQSFAELLDNQSQVSYADITKDPLICDSSLLPHIALAKFANIDGMQESESRLYLKTFNKKILGTVGAVEDAARVCFEDSKIVEWFEDVENLKEGEFKLNIDFSSQQKYGEDEFLLSEKLIKKSKNVRSKFNCFNLLMPFIEINNYISVAKTSNVKLKNELIFKDSEVNISIQGAGIWTV
jgi:P2-related tail formation protein